MGRQWPLPEGSFTITSRFAGRINPVTGYRENHSGTDFAAPDGTPFYACAGGTVQFIGSATGYGQWIVIDSPDSEGGGCYEYGHMWDAFATGLKRGDKVSAGQLIGYVGSNGQSTGPHLHLTVWERAYGGRRVDPETWLAGASYPGAPKHPSGTPTGTLFGIDVSEHQAGYNLKRAIETEDLSFVILRANDGTYVDKQFKNFLKQAEQTNALVNAYWYLRAPSEGTTIGQQVDVIDRQLEGRKDIGIWIDVESINAKNQPILTEADVWTAKRELESRGYYVPGIYSGAWYWEKMPGGEPSMNGLGYLWVSNYATNAVGDDQAVYYKDGGDNRRGWSYPLGDRKPDILQFTSNGIVGDKFPIDCNAFRGSFSDLEKIMTGRTSDKEITVAEADRIIEAINQNRQFITEFMTAFNGPIGSDTKDVREQMTGARDSIPGDIKASYPGWDLKRLLNSAVEKGYNNLTLTEMVALAIIANEEEREAVRKTVLDE